MAVPGALLKAFVPLVTISADQLRYSQFAAPLNDDFISAQSSQGALKTSSIELCSQEARATHTRRRQQ